MKPVPALEDHVRLVQSATIPHGEIDDELMALDAARGEILGLDPIGTHLWRLAREPITLGDMIRRLADEYDADEPTIRADIVPFLGDLLDCELLRIAP